MSTAMDFKTPGLPIYEVFPGVGMTPTILVTSEPLPGWDLIQWQFLGKAPAHMPMHQVVHSLQRRLAERSVWTPQMVSRHDCFVCMEKESCNVSKNMNKRHDLLWFLRQLHTSCYMLNWCWLTLIQHLIPSEQMSLGDHVPRWNRFVSGSCFPKVFLKSMVIFHFHDGMLQGPVGEVWKTYPGWSSWEAIYENLRWELTEKPQKQKTLNMTWRHD